MFGFGKKKKEEGLQSGFSSVYSIQLLYKEKPEISTQNIASRLKKTCGDIEVICSDEKDAMLGLAYKEHCVTYKDNVKVPAQGVIASGKFKLDMEKLQPSLQQSWNYRDAEGVLPQIKYQLVLTDMMAGGLEYKERLFLFQNLVQAVLMETNCEAIHWTVSEQFVDPKDYLANIDEDPLNAAINVRFYNISDGEEGDMLMDTLGLAALGIPDLQCHFHNLDPNSVGNMLYNTAYYLYENGDIINDGNTVRGLKDEDKWLCQHEMALAGPKRIVVDINPGDRFAAGKRH